MSNEPDRTPQPIANALEAALDRLAAAVRERAPEPERAPVARAHHVRRQRATQARARCWWLDQGDA